MGQTMANMQNPNITGPTANRAQWGDLDPNEKFSRVFSGGLRGLGQGMQNQGQMRSGSPINFSPVPSLPTPMYSTENLPGNPFNRNVNFYGS